MWKRRWSWLSSRTRSEPASVRNTYAVRATRTCLAEACRLLSYECHCEHLYDGLALSIIANNLIGPALFDLIYTLVCRVPMTPGMHVARLGIADTEDLGSQPTSPQLLVRWLVKWTGVLALPPVSWAVVFIWALFVLARRGLHEMASHTITYRRPIWHDDGAEIGAPTPRGQKRALPYIGRSRR